MTALDRNLEVLYSLVMGQYEPALKAKITTLEDYEDEKDNYDPASLIQIIIEATFHVESQMYQILQIHGMNMKLCSIRQTRFIVTSKYLVKFQHQVNIIDECGGTTDTSTEAIVNDLPYRETMNTVS